MLAWRDFLLTTDDEYRFSCFVRGAMDCWLFFQLLFLLYMLSFSFYFLL